MGRIRVTATRSKRTLIIQIIRNTYLSLYQQWKRTYPLSRDYPVSKVHQNIRSATSLIGSFVSDSQINNSRYDLWSSKGWKEIYYNHWYFAVILSKDSKGNLSAWIQDAHYEWKHHNDTMTTTPYDESKQSRQSLILNESELKYIIKESVQRVLQEQKKRARLSDSTINKRFGYLIHREVAQGNLDPMTADELAFYGLYNNEHFSNGGHTYFNMKPSEFDYKNLGISRHRN